MKDFLKGLALGVSLFLADKLCVYLFDNFNYELLEIFGGIVFFAITTAFLVSKDVPKLLLCGFTGLFTMFFVEIFTMFLLDEMLVSGVGWLVVYTGGFYGSMAALVVSLILTVKGINIFRRWSNMENNLSKELKIKLLIYTVVSAIGFSYLVMPESAGISVPIFAIIQLACLWFIVPDRKRLVLFIPIFIMACNSFWSANYIWRITNVLVSLVLFSCMFIKFDFKNDSLKYFTKISKKIISPFGSFILPFKWTLELNNEKAPVIKRIAIAILITIPCCIILLAILSNADMVFSMKTGDFINSIIEHINLHVLFVGIAGIIMGLYLFGVIHCAHTQTDTDEVVKEPRFKGDLIIINILLFVTLFIYTLFVIVQFKYLFAGSALPDGLTYTEYARKGFFELLALTGINIAAILIVVNLTKIHQGKWLTFTKILCHYLCAVTVVLLISSFYRMWLYTNDDGLTRLRLFVMGFLVFEAIGLLTTFVYIAHSKINITLIYACLALTYYTFLNIVPTDNIIAKNQIDKYLNGERESIEYVYTLSADAAPSMKYLFENTTDEITRRDVKTFLEIRTTSYIPKRWQRYNIATEKAKAVLGYIY